MEETFVLGLRLQLGSLHHAGKEMCASCMLHSGSILLGDLFSLWHQYGERRGGRKSSVCGVQ